MQRLFSTFPGGSPGIALLLLRSTAGLVLIGAALSSVMQSNTPDLLAGCFAVMAAVSGISLLAGLFTPFGGVLGVLSSATAALFLIPIDSLDRSQLVGAAIVVGVMAASLGVLGPGAFSIDCHLFGRRKIVIPQFPHPRNHG